MTRHGATIAHHPIHAMLIPFPIALFVFSFISDLIFRYGGTPLWAAMAYYTMLGGVIGALLAAIAGLIDYLALPAGGARTSEKATVRAIATTHMALNLTIVALYLVNLYLRRGAGPDPAMPFWLSSAAVLMLGVSGWLGGSLVYVHRVGVRGTDVEQPHPTLGPDPTFGPYPAFGPAEFYRVEERLETRARAMR